jgi:hypothetical protein
MKRILTIACVALLLAGCNTALKPTPENYLATLNKYLPDHQDCLLDGSITFPYETSDPAMTKKMDALVHSKVLDVAREPAIHISRYTLTPEGSTAGHNLCYGYREATAIVSSTPPAPANGFDETTVVYSYKVRDIPVWAKTAEIMAAFPAFAHEAGGDATDTITLALTRVGWTVPN